MTDTRCEFCERFTCADPKCCSAMAERKSKLLGDSPDELPPQQEEPSEWPEDPTAVLEHGLLIDEVEAVFVVQDPLRSM